MIVVPFSSIEPAPPTYQTLIDLFANLPDIREVLTQNLIRDMLADEHETWANRYGGAPAQE